LQAIKALMKLHQLAFQCTDMCLGTTGPGALTEFAHPTGKKPEDQPHDTNAQRERAY